MNLAVARRNMVDNQIRVNHVGDERVLLAMESVPRELFVPPERHAVAYVDEDIDLGSGRTLMEPVTFARLLQAAAIGPQEMVLDAGCGTGYSSAVLARLASTVVALEENEELRARAVSLLTGLGADNVAVIAGSPAGGDATHGPYDVIVVEGRIPSIPQALSDQLAEGGRLVAVIGNGSGVGRATLARRSRGVVSSLELFDASIGALPGFASPNGFVF